MTIRVLIADDDPAVRRVVRIFLADADDMTVVGEAECGQDAVEMIERLRPDVALIDCAMPNLDCIEVARLVKSFPETVGLVVLDTYGRLAVEAHEASTSAYILKDALRKRLLDTIRQAASSSYGDLDESN